MVAVGEVGVEHGGEREAGEGDAQAGHQLGHAHRGGHGAMVLWCSCQHYQHSGPRPRHCPQRMLLVWRLGCQGRPHLAPGPLCHTDTHIQQRLKAYNYFLAIARFIFYPLYINYICFIFCVFHHPSSIN